MPAIMIKNKEKLIPIFAMIVLLIGISSTLYVHAIQSTMNTNNIIINDNEYNIDSLFDEFTFKSIETDEGTKTGIGLDTLIAYVGISNPGQFQYTVKASDSYQKTILWENFKEGILSKEKRIFFPDLAHAFWVGNIIEIEVDEL